jgi:adenine-specific DNA-methyltransferase
VDETVDREKDNWGIEPLPNLDFKIMQGNSLISVYEGIDLGPRGGIEPSQPGLYAGQGEKAELIRLLRDKKAQYQGESDHHNKQTLQKEINQYLLDIFKVNALEQRQEYASRLAFIDRKYQSIPDPKEREKLKAIEKEKVSKKMGINIDDSGKALNKYSTQHVKRDFFPWGLYFAEVFAEKGGFDIVLGNPPYIGEKGHKELFELIKKADLKEFYMGKMDYFYFFFHLALNLSRPEGHIAFISTNYYPTATGAVKFRKDLKERSTIKKLVNFNELKIFETAQGQHNMITILSKGSNPDTTADTCITKRNGYGSPEILNQIINWQDDQTEYFEVPQAYLYDGDDFQIRVRGIKNNRDDPLQAILNNMRPQSTPLGTLCNINQGIVTGADKVSKKHIEKFHIDANKGDGIFVLREEEVEILDLAWKDKRILRPWFKNSDIMRWATNIKSNEQLIYADKRKSNLEGSKILEYLSKFHQIIEESSSNAPYLHRPREIDFDGSKIVAPQRSSKNIFGYNEIPWFASADVYYITKMQKDISLKYVLSLLNSKLFYLWLYHRGKRKGETLELYQKPLSEVPIKKISIEDQKPFVDIVNMILDLTYSDNFQLDKQKQEQVKALEEEIDQLVFNLYGLSDTEIKFVKHIGEQKNEQ